MPQLMVVVFLCVSYNTIESFSRVSNIGNIIFVFCNVPYVHSVKLIFFVLKIPATRLLQARNLDINGILVFFPGVYALLGHLRIR